MYIIIDFHILFIIYSEKGENIKRSFVNAINHAIILNCLSQKNTTSYISRDRKIYILYI